MHVISKRTSKEVCLTELTLTSFLTWDGVMQA
jgi:hypothetical protein